MNIRLSFQFYMETEGCEGRSLLAQVLEHEDSVPFGYYTISELLTPEQVDEMNRIRGKVSPYRNPAYELDRTDAQIKYLKQLLPGFVANHFGEEVAEKLKPFLVEPGRFYEVQLPPSQITDNEIHFIFYMSVPRNITEYIPNENRHRYLEIRTRDFMNIRTFAEAFDPMPPRETGAA